MTLNELLYGKQPMQPNMPGGDATLGSTGYFVPRGNAVVPSKPYQTAQYMQNLPSANVPAVTNPAAVPFMMGGNPQPNTPAFLNPNLPGFSSPNLPVYVAPPSPRSAAPAAASAPMQGPPMPGEFSVPGFAKGYTNAAPGMSAQQYADQFAGGDLGKVKARQILVDGQLVNDFYTKGLMDGLLGGPAPMKPIAGTPANVPLPPQRPAEFGPSNQTGMGIGGLLSNIPFIGGLFGG